MTENNPARRKTDKLSFWLKEYQTEVSVIVLATVFGIFLIWMLSTSMQARLELQKQNLELNEIILSKDNDISKLKAELEICKAPTPVIELPPVTPVVEHTISKSSQELNHKIEKVQTALIDQKNEPRVITKQEIQTQHVDKAIPVDKELRDMMIQSFCNVAPDDAKCKGRKK